MLLLLAGCKTSFKDAKGETPVKFVSCPLGEKDCVVSARFGDLDRCQSYKAWTEMSCNQTSTPARMICTRDRSTESDASYCTL
jgi:hypothetical protein